MFRQRERPVPEPDASALLKKAKAGGVHPFALVDLARAVLNTGKREHCEPVRGLLLPLLDVFQSLQHIADVKALIGESFFIEGDWAKARQWLERSYVIVASDKMSRTHKRMLADAHVKLGEFEQAADLYRRLLDEFEPAEACPHCVRRP